jgi:carboxymethylenebutenolidase
MLREPVDVEAIEIPYGETEDDLLRGYFVYPADMVEPLPAVIVVHEWWGLNDSVRAAASRIAAQGYMVLAVDLFRGETATSTSDASTLARKLLEEPGFAELNLRAAQAFVSDAAGAPAVATLGWSLGGYWAVEATRFLPDTFSAAVAYYAQPDDDADTVASISAPVLGLFGGQDRSIPIDAINAFQDQAKALEKPVEVVIFPRGNHGFANPDDARFDERIAEQAWRRTAEFLDRHLRAS